MTRTPAAANGVRDDLRMPTSGTVQKTPNHVLASVNIFNGDVQGSGTIISVGEEKAALLTTAHCFKGVIGGKFWIYYPDGTYTEATLVAYDKRRDLALATVDAKTVLSHSFVPESLPKGYDLTGCGFTNGRGPIFKELKYECQIREQDGTYLWRMNVTRGEFSSGDSGGGIFMDDALIGVTNSRNYCGAVRLYAAPHKVVVDFLKANSAALSGCGDWTVPPPQRYGGPTDDAPPLWKPSPNIPIYVNASVLPARNDDPAGTRRPNDVPDPVPPIPDGDPPGTRRPDDIDDPAGS